jgi:hypothetical protein
MGNDEKIRLEEDARREKNWKRWGPYLSERQWGTVREDYSPDGSAWSYFPHEHARSRAYRWGEDGLLGICDRECRLCFALALWNGKDPILKERLFGLTNDEGNHGEDVKELYAYLDSTPTHSYMKALYRYPQACFPYGELVGENRKRGRHESEYEIADTGVFDEMRYFDVSAEYAKAESDDILIRINIHNRGAEAAEIHVLPTLWFRNTWIWGCSHEGCTLKPKIEVAGKGKAFASHETLGKFTFKASPGPGGKDPELIFTENETNTVKLFNSETYTPYVKDAFHRYVVEGDSAAVNPRKSGTKMAAHYRIVLKAGESAVIRLRLTGGRECDKPFGPGFDNIFKRRISEADDFFKSIQQGEMTASQKGISRHAIAGLLWSKQFYHFVVEDWLKGDPSTPPPPHGRELVRNRDWKHLFCRDVLSMPEKWEYPWFAAWDLAFHMVPMAKVDPDFAKHQMILLLREWYQSPNGQIPAYEYNFDDVNPPVHAWACWRIYKMSGSPSERDRSFLASAFQKLLMNFTWWVNRKDAGGKHIFSGGFLGLDNIGVFDRSKPLAGGGHLEQSDATAWMAFYAGTMLSMALELAQYDPVYEDMASKFFEHFISIADAMNNLGGTGLWDEEDSFYYDQLHRNGYSTPLKIKSLVGLVPLIAVEVIHSDVIDKLPGFRKRMIWFLKNRKDLSSQISFMSTDYEGGKPGEHMLLAIPSKHRLKKVLERMLDENEFLSKHGIRSLSRAHLDNPYVFHDDGVHHRVSYVSGESDSGLFGGNSNWRGPVWFPLNYLIAESLERYHHFYGDEFKMEYPKGSGEMLSLGEIAADLHQRLASLFTPDKNGRCPYNGEDPRFSKDPFWKDIVCFHEYFDGDTGRGLGASHQTGWTALVANSLSHLAKSRGGK